MRILIVNINEDKMTQDLLVDLDKQTLPCDVTVINNDTNEDLCRIWNKFYLDYADDTLCFLNNDVRVPTNYVSDTVKVLEKEPRVGCVVHRQGSIDECSTELSYVVPKKKLCQGFDFAIRREAYTPIPEDIKVYGGDDYLFYKIYEKGWKVAVALSSPIVHLRAGSRKWYKYDRNEEMRTMMKYGCGHYPHGTWHVC